MNVQNEEGKGEAALDDLSAKQRQVLDLLIEHKTSKALARCLGISPHTVDQRIQFARDKLGARTRSEAAQAYRRLLQTYGRATYERPGIAVAPPGCDDPKGAPGPLPELSQHRRFRSRPQDEPEADFQVVPASFEGRDGALVRLGWILGIAVLLVFVIIGMLALYSQIAAFWRH